MLIFLTIVLVVASILILFIKKSKESILLFGLCFSLMLEICGVMIFIAKKGGISTEVLQFLYFSKEIKNTMQYFLITLNQLGYLIAIGRVLFPFFMIEIAMNYSMVSVIRREPWIQRAAAILPILSLILYYPPIYRYLIEKITIFPKVVAEGTMIWITAYLVLSVFLLLYEFKSITIKFCKRQYSQIMIFLFALMGIYYLYYRQDSGQVYQFYSYNNIWNKGVGYLQVDPSLFSYFALVGVSIICSFLGFYSLARYTKGSFEDSREDIVMERKFDSARVGASMFVHSMKNQLLSSKVVYKRIRQLYEQPEVDVKKLKENIDVLENLYETMLLRTEELNRFTRSKTITMSPISIEEIVENAIERFHSKYPNIDIEVELKEHIIILADKVHVCEALYNLLINAQEAVMEANRGDNGKVSLACYNERLYTVIEVKDNGKGMTRSQTKKIFHPFYSSKNSSFNWGMGLYYVREIVKSHYGMLRVESDEEEGSRFFILFPRY